MDGERDDGRRKRKKEKEIKDEREIEQEGFSEKGGDRGIKREKERGIEG